MTAEGAVPADARSMDFAAEAACYATAFFSLGLVPTMWLVVPLWALELGASPVEIGLAVGARSLLPMLFSIHGGVVMDRLGVRRVMFWLAGACILLIPLYPLMPWVPALLVLQLLFGLAQSLSWIGAQTQIGRMTAGSPAHSGRFSFAATAGTFAGPLVAGVSWDYLGPYGAYAAITTWCAALWFSIHFLPAPQADAERPHVPFAPGVLVPRVRDYVDAGLLLAIPAIALVVIATFARIAAVSVQGSFYPVYLESIDYTGTIIGSLIAASSIIGSLSALLNGALSRLVRQSWILVGAIALSVAAIAATPFFASLPALALLAGLFGIGIGLTLPPVLSILSKAAGPSRQGLSVGLRSTANRFASLVIPVGMGIVADLFDMRGAFLAVGGALIFVLAAMTVLVVRHRL